MNRRDGTKSGCSPAFIRSKWIAPAIAFAVQLPIWPWSYTAGHWGRRSTRAGSAVSTRAGAAYRKSRLSGRSRTQPRPCARLATAITNHLVHTLTDALPAQSSGTRHPPTMGDASHLQWAPPSRFPPPPGGREIKRERRELSQGAQRLCLPAAEAQVAVHGQARPEHPGGLVAAAQGAQDETDVVRRAGRADRVAQRPE